MYMVNIKIPNLTDQTYFSISQEAYDYEKLKKLFQKNRPIKIYTTETTYEKWYVERIKQDISTGLDAFVLSQGEIKGNKWVQSKEPDNVVVAFAGTDVKQLSTDVLDADGEHVVMGVSAKEKTPFLKQNGADSRIEKYVGTPSQDARLVSGDYEIVQKPTPFEQASQLVAEVKAKYAGSKTVVSTTGHSLGEAQAEYSAVKNGVFSLGFNGPSIVHLHTEEEQKRIKSGVYANTVINIVDPYDAVGSGWYHEYPRHNGSTYYTKSPQVSRTIRTWRNKQSALGFDKFIVNTLAYIIETAVLKDTNTHSLTDNTFQFDQDGNAINPVTGEYLYHRNLERFVTGTPLSLKGSETIRLTPELAKQLAERAGQMYDAVSQMIQTTNQFQDEHNQMVLSLQKEFEAKLGSEYSLLSSEDIREVLEELSVTKANGIPTFYHPEEEDELILHLHKTKNDIQEIKEFLQAMAENFAERDQTLANWLKI